MVNIFCLVKIKEKADMMKRIENIINNIDYSYYYNDYEPIKRLLYAAKKLDDVSKYNGLVYLSEKTEDKLTNYMFPNGLQHDGLDYLYDFIFKLEKEGALFVNRTSSDLLSIRFRKDVDYQFLNTLNYEDPISYEPLLRINRNVSIFESGLYGGIGNVELTDHGYEKVYEYLKENGINIYSYNRQCYGCKRNAPIYTYYLTRQINQYLGAEYLYHIDREFQTVDRICLGYLEELDKQLAKKYRTIRKCYSRTMKEEYYANCCEHCDCFTGYNFIAFYNDESIPDDIFTTKDFIVGKIDIDESILTIDKLKSLYIPKKGRSKNTEEVYSYTNNKNFDGGMSL